MEWDEAQHFPKELMPKLAGLGLLGIQFPEQYGGAAMSAVDAHMREATHTLLTQGDQ